MNEATEQSNRGGIAKRVLLMTLTTVLIALAVFAFAYRDHLTAEGLRALFGGAPTELSGDAFTYEPGSNQVFAAAGSGLAVASSSSAALFDGSGATVFRRAVSYDTPAVFASGTGALFCDLGGTGCAAVGADGELLPVEAGGEILAASRNEDGWIALTTAAPGYKGLVSVYDPAGTLKYRWYSGAGYVLSADVSPDGKTLAALCAGQGGGLLHLFRMDSEEEAASVAFPGALPYDLAFLGNGSLCAVGADALRFLDSDGTERARWDVDGELADYAFGKDFAAVCFIPSGAGTGGSLVTLDASGAVKGRAEPEGAVLSLSAQGKQVLAMTAGGMTLYDRALSPVWSEKTLMTAKQAVLRADGNALLMTAFAAELLRVT